MILALSYQRAQIWLICNQNPQAKHMSQTEPSVKKKSAKSKRSKDLRTAIQAFKWMLQAKHMAICYDENRSTAFYVHSTSRGHEAIQLAVALQLKNYDYAYPYYRDESMLLGMGFTPEQLMLQLLAKADDPFTGGRSYYNHPSYIGEGFPTIPHQSSATGMQAIPATGAAQGIAYLQQQKLMSARTKPLVLCSLGDGSVTEGEVAEAWQFAVLHRLPIIYLVQDNEWGISATGEETRTMNAYEYALGFKGMERRSIDGSDFMTSLKGAKEAFDFVRKNKCPLVLHATCPLLGHHTSGVRKEWYRGDEDLAEHAEDEPKDKLLSYLLKKGITKKEAEKWDTEAKTIVYDSFERAKNAADPDLSIATAGEFADTPILEETGERTPTDGKEVVMVDAALHAVEEIMREYPEALLYGQDVGIRLGGVFREAATLAQKFGTDRVFNTAIQEAYIIGSTAGMSATGCKPMVEIQFADYLFPGINQLVTELSKSHFLSGGKFPIQSLIRVPIGAYGGGGPYHSGSHESTLLPVKGIKVIYPSNAADMKGLLKAAFHDPNPVVVFEHKGLYWSKVPGTEAARTIEPDEAYMVPLGKARIALAAADEKIKNGESLAIITYGMGVHWALNAAKKFENAVEILDLRTLNPVDNEAIFTQVKKHGKVIVLTEESLRNSFAEALSGRIATHCFEFLDAPVKTIGAKDSPAIPLNIALEKEILPNAAKLAEEITKLLEY